jgi:NtrC-family two-component system response regulator AlgB
MARADLAQSLRSRGHRVDSVADPNATLDSLDHQEFDVILADSQTVGPDGSLLLRDLLRHHPEAAVALTTARPTVAEAVDVMRAGAVDYLEKPLSLAEVEGLVESVVRLRPRAHQDRRATLGTGRPHGEPADDWQSTTPQMMRAVATARHVADSDVPVLLTGESGTGKKTLAAAIHNWSQRRANPFVTVWCDALSEHRLESGLLEHLHGALTGMPTSADAGADALQGGTLFFDDIGNGKLPAPLQVRLLAQLEGAHFGNGRNGTQLEPRIVAATHHDLEADVRSGRLREDLFFHLNVVTIALPPLRDRIDDLPALRDRFLAQLAAHHRRAPVRLTPEAERVLAGYHWPGNLRELMNILERAVVLSHGDRIGADELAPNLAEPAPDNGATSLSLVEIEQRQIQLALKESATLADAAARLGIDPATLWRKRKRYGLKLPLGHRRRVLVKQT